MQRPAENEDAADSTLDITTHELSTKDNTGLQLGEYLCHADINFQLVSDMIDAMDPVFDQWNKLGKPIAKRSKDLVKDEMVVSTEPKKEKVMSVR